MAFNEAYIKDDEDYARTRRVDVLSSKDFPSYNNCTSQITRSSNDSLYAKRLSSIGSLNIHDMHSISTRLLDKISQPHHCSIQKYLSCRWRVAYLALTGLILQVAHRNCISVALVCMTKSIFGNGTTHGNSTVESFTEYKWSPHVEGMILSAYFYGQIISPLISGVLCKHYSMKNLMALYVIISSCLLIITPWVAAYGAWTLIVVRGAQGFFGSGCLPMYSKLWSHWAPRQEKSQLIAFTFSGLDIGVIVAFSASGFLCTLDEGNGWPLIFYSFGTLSLLWCAMWLIFVTDSPEEHMYISDAEKMYIANNCDNSMEKIPDTPWCKILTSPSVYAMLIGITSVAWGMTVVFSFLPKYMNDVLNYDITKNGLMSSLPFVGRGLSIIFIGKLSDFFLNKNVFRTTTMRKINQCGAGIIGAALIIPVGFLSEGDSHIAVMLITLSSAALGGTMSGSYANILEIFPRHASSLSGLAFGLNGIGQTLAPIAVGQVIKTGSRQEWMMVYISIGAVYAIGALLYFIYGSADSEEEPESLNVEENTTNKAICKNCIKTHFVYIISDPPK